MGGIVVAYKPREGECGEARDKEGACRERESAASKETAKVGGAGGNRGWKPRVIIGRGVLMPCMAVVVGP